MKNGEDKISMETSILIPTIHSFVALFVILDPFLGLALFITLTRNMKPKERYNQAFVAVGVAFVLLAAFLFLGPFILSVLNINFSSFKVAGGIILLIMGVQAVLGLSFSKKDPNIKAAAVIVGTPILTGPGAMTTVVVLSQQYGIIAPLIAAFVALALTWLMLVYASQLQRMLGERFIQILSRVMGLILAALAAEFIKDGIIDMIAEFGMM